MGHFCQEITSFLRVVFFASRLILIEVLYQLIYLVKPSDTNKESFSLRSVGL